MAAAHLRSRVRLRLWPAGSLGAAPSRFLVTSASSLLRGQEKFAAGDSRGAGSGTWAGQIVGDLPRGLSRCIVRHLRILAAASVPSVSEAAREKTSPAAAGGLSSARAWQQIRRQHTDEWLVQRALEDQKRRQARQRPRRSSGAANGDAGLPQNDHLVPSTLEEEKIAGVLGRPDLIVTRNVEWANLAFGFEQQNKYVIMDPREPQAPVGYILEDSNVLMRQFLRRRRPFVAQILDAYGNEICRVRRPIWFINSTIFLEVGGKVIGEAHRRWHLWRRVYDCYLGTKQFAAVDNPGFWYWTFTLLDEKQGTLAVIDRNWRGFGFEFLTDAGQYVVRFGDSVPNYAPRTLRSRPLFEDVRLTGGPILAGSGSQSASTEMQSLRAAAEQAEELVVSRPLSLSERAVVIALAVSLDNDYFSHHSSGFGFIPLPFFGGSEEFAPTEDGIPADAPVSSEAFSEEDSFQDAVDQETDGW